jgi:hypothetical protein
MKILSRDLAKQPDKLALFYNEMKREVERVLYRTRHNSVQSVEANESSYLVKDNDYLIRVTYTAVGACEVIVPESGCVKDRVMVVKDESRSAGTNNITVRAINRDINGASSVTMSTNGDGYMFYCDGTDWHRMIQ